MVQTADEYVSLHEIPLDQGLVGTLEHMTEALDEHELAGAISGICKPSNELDELRLELNRLRRRNAAITARLTDMQEDLSEAATLQREMEATRTPSLKSARIHRFQRPVEAVSGDLCIVERIDEDHIALTIADATGHGVAAAMLTAFCRPLIRTEHLAPDVNPARILENINKAICRLNLTGCQFVTAVMAVYNDKTRELTWSRAGAPFPTVVSQDGTLTTLTGDGGLLGMSPDMQFETSTVTLKSDDRLLIHSDGVESLIASSTGQPLATQGLLNSWYRELAEQESTAFLDKADRQIAAMDHEMRDIDDVTMLILDVTG